MRKKRSQNADRSANLLTQAAMTAPWGIAITDHQRRGNPVVFVNQAFEAVSCYDAAETLGKSWRRLLGRDPERHSLTRLQEAVRQGSHCSVNLQSFGKDGSRLQNELSVAPVLNRSRGVTHLIWLCRDITSQVEREARLASTVTEKDERFSSYLEITTDAFWRLDFKPPIRLDIPESQQVREIFQNGVFREVDDAGARIYGLNKGAEVIGQPLGAFMDPSEPKNVKRVVELVKSGFRMNNLISYEKDVDGTTHTILNNVAPGIEDGQVQYLWGASRDVTEHFEALRALEQSREELAEKAVALEEKNTALREILAQIELDKKEFKDRIAANIEQVLLPSLDRIQLQNDGAAYIEQHRQALRDLMSSFGRRIADGKLKLTPREVEICAFVKNGLRNKEIASLLKIAVHTVEKHRRTARSKLGLANKGINLRTYLDTR